MTHKCYWFSSTGCEGLFPAWYPLLCHLFPRLCPYEGRSGRWGRKAGASAAADRWSHRRSEHASHLTQCASGCLLCTCFRVYPLQNSVLCVDNNQHNNSNNSKCKFFGVKWLKGTFFLLSWNENAPHLYLKADYWSYYYLYTSHFCHCKF